MKGVYSPKLYECLPCAQVLGYVGTKQQIEPLKALVETSSLRPYPVPRPLVLMALSGIADRLSDAREKADLRKYVIGIAQGWYDDLSKQEGQGGRGWLSGMVDAANVLASVGGPHQNDIVLRAWTSPDSLASRSIAAGAIRTFMRCQFHKPQDYPMDWVAPLARTMMDPNENESDRSRAAILILGMLDESAGRALHAAAEKETDTAFQKKLQFWAAEWDHSRKPPLKTETK